MCYFLCISSASIPVWLFHWIRCPGSRLVALSSCPTVSPKSVARLAEKKALLVHVYVEVMRHSINTTSKLQIAKRVAPLLPINQSTSVPTVLISPRMISVKHVRASIDSSIYHAILGGDSPLPPATYIHIYLVQI